MYWFFHLQSIISPDIMYIEAYADVVLKIGQIQPLTFQCLSLTSENYQSHIYLHAQIQKCCFTFKEIQIDRIYIPIQCAVHCSPAWLYKPFLDLLHKTQKIVFP